VVHANATVGEGYDWSSPSKNKRHPDDIQTQL